MRAGGPSSACFSSTLFFFCCYCLHFELDKHGQALEECFNSIAFFPNCKILISKKHTNNTNDKLITTDADDDKIRLFNDVLLPVFI